MSRYGLDYYGLAYYGSDNPIKFDASPFKALPSKQGQILLSWADPKGSWSKLVVVRNPYGFPVDVSDGITILTAYNGADPTIFQDTNLTQGAFYYYSIFVFSLIQYSWVKAGDAFAVSVKDHGNSAKMYSYLPEIYKIQYPYSPTSDWSNPDLYAFLSNFGFELDYEQTMTDLLTNRYNPEKVSGALIPVLMNQFGQTYEPAVGLQQNRILLRDGVTLTKQKGSKEGLLGFIKDFSSWGIPIPIAGTPNPSVNGVTVSHNIMLDYNDSSFEESTGHWVSSDGTANITQLKIYNILNISATSGTATITIGAHKYDAGSQIVIQGLPYPLFNSTSPVTLTAVDQTAGTLSFSTSSSDFTSITGYNATNGAYGTVTPYPSPWVEPTAPSLFPNKAKSIAALYNSSASSQTISAYVGDDSPITKGIPVTAATTYSFSIYASSGNYTARTVTAKIKWFDRFGTYLSTSSGSGVSDSASTGFVSSVRPSVSHVAPTGAYYACPGVSIASVGGTSTHEHHYFDAAQFEAASSPTDFDEARQLHITLRANRINELTNPNFSTSTAPWTSTNATQTITNSYQEPNTDIFTIYSASIVSNVATVTVTLPHSYQVGQSVTISGVTGANASNYNGARTITAVTLNTFSYAVTASNSTVSSGKVFATGHQLQVTATGSSVKVSSWDGSTTSQLTGIYYPNTSYTFSVYAQPITASENIVTKINWYDSSYTFISSTSSPTLSLATGYWTRDTVTSTAPATAAYASVEVDWNTTSSHVLLLDRALFENNGQVLDYFDGSTGLGDYRNFIWEGGVANAARSHYYKNSFVVQTRLYGATLNAVLPLGSTVAVYVAQPNT
jgi:hypothetical protein